jgi:hypothetical protein
MLNLIRNTRPFQSVLTIILAALLFLGVAGVNNALAHEDDNLVGKMKGTVTCYGEVIEKNKVKSKLYLEVFQSGHHIRISGLIEEPAIEFEVEGIGFLVNNVKGIFSASTKDGPAGDPFFTLKGNFKWKDHFIHKVWGNWQLKLHNDSDLSYCVGMGKFNSKQKPIEED